MEAQLVSKLPQGEGWQFEPKWDGFRCIAYRFQNEIDLRSKSGQPLARYFPEVVANLKALSAPNFVLDGELVIKQSGAFNFDDLLKRIHPAQSRIEKLSREAPASYLLFDMLMNEHEQVLVQKNLQERRAALESFAQDYLGGVESIALTPYTQDRDIAESWLTKQGVIMDGVIAKRIDLPYQSGNRKGMVKVKRKRTADCVVGGFRYSSQAKEVGSLLLGVFDDNGDLHHIGFTSALSASEKKRLTPQLESLITQSSFTRNVPGGPSRWSNERSADWQALKPELVVEVEFDQITNGRFRHGTKLLRWRPDKAPEQCKLDQIAN